MKELLSIVDEIKIILLVAHRQIAHKNSMALIFLDKKIRQSPFLNQGEYIYLQVYNFTML